MDNQPKKILITDDDRFSRKTTAALLSQEPYKLYFASSGAEALSMVDEEPPDLILLDVMMPGMDGFQVCRFLRAEEAWQHIPIILVTALDSLDDLTKGLDAGADEFLSKPVNGIELRARVRSMLRIKDQYDHLKESLQLRQDLTNMIVHDLKNPLAVLSLHIKLMENALGTQNYDRLDRYATVLRKNTLRLTDLADEILVMAKTEAGKISLNPIETELQSLLLQVIEDHQPIADSSNIQIALSIESTVPPIAVDAKLVQRMLDNLLSNAIKFSFQKETVSITLAANGNANVVIQVADTGRGIPNEFKERVFDRFEIISMAQEQISQFGLGLAFCRVVAEAHNGSIHVEDNDPQGSRFVVTLPFR
jgi:signal transduction histidine kinase